MKKILLLSQVAALAREIERQQILYGEDADLLQSRAVVGLNGPKLEGIVRYADDEEDESTISAKDSTSTRLNLPSVPAHTGLIIDPGERDPITGGISQSQRSKIVELFGNW